jgi:hypothetical protein
VAWLHGDEAVQQLSSNVFLYNLAQIRGTSAVLSRIPKEITGVYAWYRCFELEPAAENDPEVLVNSIIKELQKAHSAARVTKLPPTHRIALYPETSFSKEALLTELSTDASFRHLLFTILNNSLIFQQPLYIGKATNLYNRIRSHLREESILRERLEVAGHNLNRCRLLLIQSSQDTSTIRMSEEDDEFENVSIEEDEFHELDAEGLFEDILSRLFLPLFTLRYG